ncbi:hypothetical protein WA158_005219 [Blastocystis sp. Blastoise]
MQIFLLFLIVMYCESLNHSNSYYKTRFDAYISQFNREYTSQESRYRLYLFSENLDFIEKENLKKHSYKLGITPFIDLSDDEFKASKFCGCLMKQPVREKHVAYINRTIPESVNWVEKGVVNAIKDQRSCGSCWAFSAVAAMEGMDAIKNGKLQSFSEQQLVDCDISSFGCAGGFMDNAFLYVIQNKGICSEESYPYTAKDEDCKDKKCTSIATVSDYVDIEENNGEQLLMALANQPVSVAIEADSFVFKYYQSGIIDAEDCGSTLNHGVAAVGYGIEDGIQYILVRNSWGENWGEQGYVRLAHYNKGEGVCGINLSASYPLI